MALDTGLITFAEAEDTSEDFTLEGRYDGNDMRFIIEVVQGGGTFVLEKYDPTIKDYFTYDTFETTQPGYVVVTGIFRIRASAITSVAKLRVLQ